MSIMHPTFLAQVPQASQTQLLTVLMGGAALLAMLFLLLQVIKLMREMFGKDARSSDAVAASVTKLEARMNQFEEQIGQKLYDMNITRERQAGELYEEINKVGRMVERILGRLEEKGR